jgi:hypothetical protein
MTYQGCQGRYGHDAYIAYAAVMKMMPPSRTASMPQAHAPLKIFPAREETQEIQRNEH